MFSIYFRDYETRVQKSWALPLLSRERTSFFRASKVSRLSSSVVADSRLRVRFVFCFMK